MSSSLRPPSASPSPSPSPANNGRVSPNPNGTKPASAANARASMGTSRSPVGNSPLPSPRPVGMMGLRPTSELLAGGPNSAMFKTPEADAIDQWFENLQNYEETLEEMAAASLDVNFKEELSAIEQWFRVLSEAERTAALYSLLQHSTQVQIRFFITVLQQMARSDPMTALLSPAVGGSMQAQMEAKLQSIGLKSPALKTPASPGRSFSGSAQRASMDASNFLSVESANVGSPSPGDSAAAATLAQQRAKLKNRISAPGPLPSSAEARNVWQAGASQLGQVVERGPSPSDSDANNRETTGSDSHGSNLTANTTIRPKSTDFAGVANAFKSPRANIDLGLEEQFSPMMDRNWASLVNTPALPMFPTNANGAPGAATGAGASDSLDAAASKLATWSLSNTNPTNRVVLDDARKFRRTSATKSTTNENMGVYGDDGTLIAPGGQQPGAGNRNMGHGSQRSISGGNSNFLGGQTWNAGGGNNGARSPALSNVSSGRFGSDDGGMAAANFASGLGAGMGSPNMGLGMGMGGMGMGMGMGMGLPGMGGFGMLNPMAAAGFNPALAQLGPEAQAMLAAQMGWGNAAMANAFAGMNARRPMGRAPGKPGSTTGSSRGPIVGGDKEKEEEVDPALLNDVPAWLRSLRLHKYTPNFEGMRWQDMVVMSEEQLEMKGVAALGARRKMLKTFELVRAKMNV